MRDACKYLFNYTDFTSFSKQHTQTATNDCKISEASWDSSDGKLVFTITADRFLRNMVRAIVGTMMEIGTNKLKPEDMGKIIEAADRSEAGFSVPAQGLFLEHVDYGTLLPEHR
jgi:tRNA pseudouridine38-40 synthase